MSFNDCVNSEIDQAAKEGRITEKQAKKLKKEFGEQYKKYAENFPDVGDAERAAGEFIRVQQKRLEAENAASVKHTQMQVLIQAKIEKNFEEALRGWESMGGVQKRIVKKPTIGGFVRDLYQDTQTRQNSLQKRMLLKITDFLQKHESKMAGFVQDIEGIPNVVRSMVGEDVGDADAKLLGGQLRSLYDELRTMYEQEGGIIGEIPNYFPQSHNPIRVREVSFAEWRDFILPKLDLGKMRDWDTGLSFDSDAARKRLEELMIDDYEAIKTNGLSEISKKFDRGETVRKPADVYKRQQVSRFYHFKDADSFLEYNQRFGVGDEGLYDSIIAGVTTMTRDIGLMQKLGPKANSMARHMDAFMEAKGVTPNSRTFTNGMYDILSGRLGEYGQFDLWYRFIDGTKALTRFYLGSAAISAISDTAFLRMALKMRGIPATRGMKRYFNGLNPASKADQRAMQRWVGISSSMNGNSLQAARFADDVATDGGKVVQSLNFMSNAIIRASGLGRMTDQGRFAAMTATMGEFDELAKRNVSWANLNPRVRETLERFDIRDRDYRLLKKAQSFVEPESGASFIRAQDILSIEPFDGVSRKDILDLAAKYDDMVTNVGDVAVNEPNLRTKAMTTGAIFGNAKRGSGLRAIAGMLTTFKSFPITVLNNFFLPQIRDAAQGKRGVMMDLATTFGMATLFGAMALQAKQVIQGKTPRDMDDSKFWMAASMQGGGLGIFGDFLFDDYSRFGHSLAESLAGPVVSTYSDVIRIVNGNYNRAMEEGKESKFLGDTFNVMKRFVPGATLWYARLPIERLMLDGIERAIDPEFTKKRSRQEKNLQRKYGQQYYWRRGEALPE